MSTTPTPTADAAGPRNLYNPLLPEFRQDPHPFFHRMRAQDPVHWSPVFQVWVLTRHADCVAALRDERLSASALNWNNYDKFFRSAGANPEPGVLPPSEVFRNWMLQMDAPDHTRLRGLVNKAFTPRAAEAMRPRVQIIVDQLIDAHPDGMDLVRDFAYPLPLRVISEMMGVPLADFERIKQWSAASLPAYGPVMSAAELRQIGAAMGEFRQYLGALIDARHARGPSPDGPDLLDALIDARDEGHRLSDAELIATCILLIFAGHMTTVQLVAGAMVALFQHPAELARLRADPSLAAGAIEETLRFDGPLQVVNRTAREDFEFGGKMIRKGQMLLISLTAANRDPEQFPDPDRFDIARRDNRHLAFGYAAHYCAGAPLARLEAQVAIQTLLRRYPQLSLDGDIPPRERSLLFRGLTSVPLRFKGADA